MKFKFYITSLMVGCIYGTNDEEQARIYAMVEDNFVVDTETGHWITADESLIEVTEAKKVSL